MDIPRIKIETRKGVYKSPAEMKEYILMYGDLDRDEGVIVPFIEDDKWYPHSCWSVRIRAVEDYPGMEFSDKTSTMQLPKHLADDLAVWEHELIEITVAWLLHTVFKEDSESKWDGQGEIPLELNPKIEVGHDTHYVQHIMSALTNISGYHFEVISAEEYASKLSWRKHRRSTA